MGLDVFLFNPIMKDEKNKYWDYGKVRSILVRDAVDPDFSTFVEYPDGGGAGEVFGLDDGDDRDGVMFAHFGGRTFMERMFEIADQTRSLIFWTNEVSTPPYGVTRPELIDLVPKDFFEGDPPHLIRDVDHLAELMGRCVLTPMRYIRCG